MGALQNAIVGPVDMSYVPPQRVTICSIYPGKLLPVKRPLFGKTWTFVPGSKSSPTYIIVEDCFQRVYHGEQFGERLTRELAERVANDIINEVTSMLADSDAQEDAFPGIFVCKKTDKDGNTVFTDHASKEQIEEYTGKQERFLRRQVNTARELHRLKLDHRIDEKHRVAARNLGIRGEEWQGEFEEGANTACPWCQRMIPASAKKCAHCAAFTKPEYAAEYALMEQAATPKAPEPASAVASPVKPPIAQKLPT